jgi:hypothetical protein
VAWVYLLILAVAGWLMISRRLTATLALPLAALAIGTVAVGTTVPTVGWAGAGKTLIADVIEGGLMRLVPPILAVLLGAVLAAQLKLSGAAEHIVRYAAEYAGENRFRIGLIILCAAALLFTTLGGLGAVILVASITLPLLLSLGFDGKIAAALMLLALSLGGCLNPVNWALFTGVLGLTTAQIIPYALVLAGIFFAVAVGFLLRHAASDRPAKEWAVLGVLLALIAAIAIVVIKYPEVWLKLKHGLGWIFPALLAILFFILLVRCAGLLKSPAPNGLFAPGNFLAGASVLVPLLLLLWSSLDQNLHGEAATVNVPINTALLCGIVFAALASLSTATSGVNSLMRALNEGVVGAAPAVILLLGIGMLLKATALAPVNAAFTPWMARLPIGNPLGYVLTFALLSPLALYRGPLNLYGMGSGVVGIISGALLVSNALLMVAFMSVGMLQGVCDPTNTHNVWIANYCRVPVNDLTRLLFPWVLGIVVLGLVAGAAMFNAGF